MNIPFARDKSIDKSIYKAGIGTPNGYLFIPDEVLAIDLIPYSPYSPYIQQWKDKFYFYFLKKIKLGIMKKGENLRGVSQLKFDINFPKDNVFVIDHGPKTEWKTAWSISLSGNDLKFKIGLIEGKIPITINYKWEKRIGKVISTSADQHTARFVFKKAVDYLDGERELYFVFRLPKNANAPSSFPIKISNIEITYDTKLSADITEMIPDEKIPHPIECLTPT